MRGRRCAQSSPPGTADRLQTESATFPQIFRNYDFSALRINRIAKYPRALVTTSAVAHLWRRGIPTMSEHGTKQDQETWSQKAKRLNVSSKTLDRWAEAGRISKPIKINKRKYGPAG